MVDLLTKERGRVSFFARGAKRNKSRVLNLSERFVEGEYNLVQGRSSYYLKDGLLLDAHIGLRRSLGKMSSAGFFMECLSAVLFEEEDPSVFPLLQKALSAAEDAEGEAALSALIGAFLLKLSSVLGFRPTLSACMTCGKPVDRNFQFDPLQGGVVCEDHAMGSSGFALEQESYRLLCSYILEPFSAIIRNSVKMSQKETIRRVTDLCFRYFCIHTGKESFKSRSLLRQLELMS